MTPKQKAEELFNKYKKYTWGNTAYTRLVRQKQCAIIAVDEIRKSCRLEADWYYWDEVKAELIKL